MKEAMMPWSKGWVMELVLGGRKTNLMDLRLMLEWAVQLSRMRATFLFCVVKILSCL